MAKGSGSQAGSRLTPR